MEYCAGPWHDVDIEFVGGSAHHRRVVIRLPAEPHLGTELCLPTLLRWYPTSDVSSEAQNLPHGDSVYRLEPKGARWLARVRAVRGGVIVVATPRLVAHTQLVPAPR